MKPDNSMTEPLILISNDDGIRAPGIKALKEACRELGEVWVAAPEHEQSAKSHAISLHEPLRFKKYDEREFSITGTPSDAVYCGIHHLLPRKPDIVISGINSGPNLGNDVIYSGTVAAAMEGAMFDNRAIAVSLCLPEHQDQLRGKSLDYSVAAKISRDIAYGCLQRPVQPGITLNVNVPYTEGKVAGGVKVCRLGYTNWASSVHERKDPRGKRYYWIGGERSGSDGIVDSDNEAIAKGFVSVTPLHYDLTASRSFQYLRDLPIGSAERLEDGLGNEPLDPVVMPL
jgi:5'-nucleotidase